ncbi:unnamed protein product [Arctia plantaginis]|uniref:Chaoptin n=1 Tax=Arctia plantaginis TaxID=874455 RepID=A0A8S1BFH1_ARCPL|nr:unnamed protein product [Arctia plantaginis]
MDMRIFYIIFYAIVAASADMCTVSDEIQCSYTITCINYFNLNMNWDRFIYYDGQHHERCHHLISHNGHMMYPVTLVLKQTLEDLAEPVPNIMNSWNAQELLKIIHTLDLSENNYHQTPIINSMMNLVVLNISNNELTTGFLSNYNPLSMLTQLDLSNNMISDLKVNPTEQPYNKLTIIDLSHNYLVNIPDAVFDSFDDMETLDLSYNYIDILSQFTFEGIKKLVYLNLSNNRLTDINSALFRFSELLTLNLSANRINKLKMNDFKNLIKLKLLDLSSNNIKTIDVNVFQAMISLKSLDLRHNLLEVLDKNVFANLKSLDSIELTHNKIKTLPKRLFTNMTILTFSISENRLEGSLDKGMFEGINVTRLDLSNQYLTEIKDYTFYNLVRLDTLTLKSNRILNLEYMCFETLVNLQILDLSNNQIMNINFDKSDLGNLQSFILKNNRLTEIKHEQLQHLKVLEYLDISGNMITHLEPNSFRFLKNLINLEINSNPLEGVLETATFQGLGSLPSLDISRSMLTTIKNATFNDMTALKNLDMSYCRISELQYNIFLHTGYIETLDLSHNQLKDFVVNTTELKGLSMLFLHNNFIKTISPTSFGGLSRLNNLTLSYNVIVSIDSESFNSLIDLRYLDVSYNEKCNITRFNSEKVKELNTLVLSGIKTTINFAHFVQDNQISDLLISNASIQNISDLHLSGISHVDTLDLSYNNISKLQIGDFTELHALRHLDLSFNKIAFIQPGTFKNNTLMSSLNISHNYLQSISYGIFHGLHYLNILDMSYNNINDLRSERFYELNFLSQLIVDHNKIDSLNADDFIGTSLTKLSIGDNPLSCDILVNLKRNPLSFEITALRIDEHMNENVNGVVCNKVHEMETTVIPKHNRDDIEIVKSLQNILLNLSKNNVEKDNKDIQYLEKISNLLEKSNSIYDEKMSNLINLTSSLRTMNNRTNIMLNEIIKLLDINRNGIVSTTAGPTTQAVTVVFVSDTPKYYTPLWRLETLVRGTELEVDTDGNSSKIAAQTGLNSLTLRELCVSTATDAGITSDFAERAASRVSSERSSLERYKHICLSDKLKNFAIAVLTGQCVYEIPCPTNPRLYNL